MELGWGALLAWPRRCLWVVPGPHRMCVRDPLLSDEPASEDSDSDLEEAPSGGLLALALGASPPPHSALEWPAGDEPFSRGSSFAALQAEEARAGPVMSGAHGTALVRVHAAACLPRLAACRRPHAAAHRAAQDIHCLRVHLWCTFHALYFALCERSTRYLFQIVAPCLAPCLVPCSACM